MNLFILDTDPRRCARYHCDKHVVKMVLETAQMLSTVRGGPYKPTHANHPCTLWVGENVANYYWAWRLGMELCKEYTYRYGRVHKCEAVIRSLAVKPKAPKRLLSPGKRTPFAQAMPDAHRNANAVVAYRKYYRHEKRHFATYRQRPVPAFMLDQLDAYHQEAFNEKLFQNP